MPAHREQLEALRDSINSRSLRSEIYHDVDAIFKLPCAESCWPQNVHLTLAQNRDNGKETLSDLGPDTPWHVSRYFPAYHFDRSAPPSPSWSELARSAPRPDSATSTWGTSRATPVRTRFVQNVVQY